MKKPILLMASSNPGKLKEVRRILGARFECLSPLDADVRPPDVVEDGTTYYENALKKAVAYQKIYRVPVLADDSGLEVDVLEGAPGVHSARFGGEGISWTARWRHLHEKLATFPESQWKARFRSVLCYFDNRHVPYFFEGTSEGFILKDPKGHEGFGYDPVFYSTPLRKSFGEATPMEKEDVSHRAVAARNFLLWADSVDRA